MYDVRYDILCIDFRGENHKKNKGDHYVQRKKQDVQDQFQE